MIEKKEYLTRRKKKGFAQTLFVDQSGDGQFRIYVRLGGSKHVYRPLNQPFLTKECAQESLNDYARKNKLVRTFRLDR
jgi:hypothetical protein